jgi:hypothetical protein
MKPEMRKSMLVKKQDTLNGKMSDEAGTGINAENIGQ